MRENADQETSKYEKFLPSEHLTFTGSGCWKICRRNRTFLLQSLIPEKWFMASLICTDNNSFVALCYYFRGVLLKVCLHIHLKLKPFLEMVVLSLRILRYFHGIMRWTRLKVNPSWNPRDENIIYYIKELII